MHHPIDMGLDFPRNCSTPFRGERPRLPARQLTLWTLETFAGDAILHDLSNFWRGCCPFRLRAGAWAAGEEEEEGERRGRSWGRGRGPFPPR